ncbi:hypothetical protein GJAV_G00014030 [Gymnothorax javanicus]|nr:hypothetical protein GJAV_G00014030 [Gymnothorax javanicus]
MDEKARLIDLAKIAEQCERYEDMADFMKQAILLQQELTDEERNLLSVAYKNVVGALRSAWRVLCCLEHRSEGEEQNTHLIKQYREKIKGELTDVCEEVQSLLDKHLIKEDNEEMNPESNVFYLKMKGDYYRYLAEVCDDAKEVIDKSENAYDKAYVLSKEKLEPVNPVRLGLALNFSVYFYEIRNSPEKACQLAKEALDDGLAQLESVCENSGKDCTLIMQLLRDNLALWTPATAADECEAGEGGES